MEPTTKPDGPTSLETLNGGSSITVTKLDGSTESVRVLQLPIKSFGTLLELQQNEQGLVELYTGKEAGFAATLTRDSAMDVIEEGDRLNADFFARWVRRRMGVQKRLAFAAGIPETTPDIPATSRSGLPKSPSQAG